MSLSNFYRSGEGRSEPVPIEVKAGRSGLGHDTELYRKRTAASAARVLTVQKRQKLEENRRQDFRERQRTTFAEKRAERDLYKSQKVCEQLDAQKVMSVLCIILSVVFIFLQKYNLFCAVLVSVNFSSEYLRQLFLFV